MKILIDSSTLYSALAYAGKEREMLHNIANKYQIVTTDYIIEE